LGTSSLAFRTIYAGTDVIVNGQSVCLANGTNCQAGAANYWDQINGVLTPKIETQDLLLGATATTSAKFAFMNNAGGTPTASIAGSLANNALYVTGDGTMGTTNKQSLTIGSNSTGNIILSGFSTGLIHSNASGVLSSGAVNLGTSDVTGTLVVGNGGTGQTTFTSNAVILGNGSGALSQSNVGTANQVLRIPGAGGAPAFGAIDISQAAAVTGILSVANGGSPFEVTAGAITQRNTTEDFLLGGTATSSARFAVLNINAGNTPTASLSGTTGGTYLTADGTLGTTNNQNLTFGGASTGNITLAPLNGVTGSYVAPNTNNHVDLGTSSLAFRTIYAGTDVIVNGQSVCLANGTNCQAGAANYWDQINGVLTPKIETQDILFGAQATSSAKFAFVNVNSGTPTASISAIGTNNALSLDANGSIYTTNKESLVLGNSGSIASTGNILLNPNATGFVGIGTANPVQALDVGNGQVRANDFRVTTAVVNDSNSTNARMLFATTGSTIDRNIADSNPALIVQNLNASSTGDILDLKNNSSTVLTVAQNGNISATGTVNLGSLGASSVVYTDGSKNLTTAAPVSGVIGYLQRNAGALSPTYITDDLLLGATATTSAKFAFENVAGGTPTASIAGSLANNALYDRRRDTGNHE